MVALRLFTIDARRVGGDRHELARRIAAAGADVAVVQHAPSLLRWRSTCAAIGRESGLVTTSGGRTGGGALLLTSLGVNVRATGELTFAGHRGPRPPGAALASLDRLGAAFLLGGVRLDRDRTRQDVQLGELDTAIEQADPSRPPIVLCVAEAGSAAALRLQDGRTAPAAGVFCDSRITARNSDGGVVELTLPG